MSSSGVRTAGILREHITYGGVPDTKYVLIIKLNISSQSSIAAERTRRGLEGVQEMLPALLLIEFRSMRDPVNSRSREFFNLERSPWVCLNASKASSMQASVAFSPIFSWALRTTWAKDKTKLAAMFSSLFLAPVINSVQPDLMSTPSACAALVRTATLAGSLAFLTDGRRACGRLGGHMDQRSVRGLDCIFVHEIACGIFSLPSLFINASDETGDDNG